MSYDLKFVQAKNAAEAYKKLTSLIELHGTVIQSRNELTKEVLNVAVEIENPRDRIINIEKFNLPFILQEAFDILNTNPPRVIHSKEMLQKTMGNSGDPMFFGNELRQALSRWSLNKIYQRFLKDKNTRKAVLDLGNRRNTKHTPCMLFAHFIIRDNKFYMTAETRGTAASMGFINDVFLLTLVQELIYGWLKPHYPELELGSFMYKTISLHEYINGEVVSERDGSHGTAYTWSQSLNKFDYVENKIDLSYLDYMKDMGILYQYVDDYMKMRTVEDIDHGDLILVSDILKPQKSYFTSEFFYNWANVLYWNAKSLDFGPQNYLEIFHTGDIK